jgi:hypothetical protein
MNVEEFNSGYALNGYIRGLVLIAIGYFITQILNVFLKPTIDGIIEYRQARSVDKVLDEHWLDFLVLLKYQKGERNAVVETGFLVIVFIACSFTCIIGLLALLCVVVVCAYLGVVLSFENAVSSFVLSLPPYFLTLVAIATAIFTVLIVLAYPVFIIIILKIYGILSRRAFVSIKYEFFLSKYRKTESVNNDRQE